MSIQHPPKPGRHYHATESDSILAPRERITRVTVVAIYSYPNGHTGTGTDRVRHGRLIPQRTSSGPSNSTALSESMDFCQASKAMEILATHSKNNHLQAIKNLPISFTQTC